MKRTILIVITIALTVTLSAQTVHFSYDASGNRISRTIMYKANIPDSTATAADTTMLKSGTTPSKATTEYSAGVGTQTIKIYPNPNNGYFTIKIEGWDNASKANIMMTTLTGKSIIEKEITGEITKVGFRDQPDGTYILTIVLNGRRESWKVVKR